jgi:hypothetical protein
MEFIRTFHPVGQGAFYTERHTVNGEEFNIVYDCGSISIAETELKKEIEATFSEEQKIDVLFISHFHDDHINGIKFLKDRCEIKLVVMPFVDEKAKILLSIFNEIEGGYQSALILINELSLSDTIKTIQIKDISENNVSNSPIEISDDNNLSSGTRSSSTNFTIKSTHWYYIPYNFDAATKRDEFFGKLAEKGIKIKKEGNTMGTIDWNKKDEIKQIYKDIYQDKDKNKALNKSSMVLFSGKGDKDTVICKSSHIRACIWRYLLIKKRKINSGCLYTGDIYLKGKVSDIKDRLSKYGFYKNIGTLQVPHHGAIKNFDCSVLDGKSIKCAVISYGTDNDYGHPSTKVVEELRVNDVCDHHVTECPSSVVIQVKK